MKYVLFQILMVGALCGRFNEAFPKKVIYFVSRACANCPPTVVYNPSTVINPLEAQQQLLILKLVFHESQKAFLKAEKKYFKQLSSTKVASLFSIPFFGLAAILLGTQQQLNINQRVGTVAVTMAAASGFFYLFSKGLESMKKDFTDNRDAYREFLEVLHNEVEIEFQKNKLPEAQDLLHEIDQAQNYLLENKTPA